MTENEIRAAIEAMALRDATRDALSDVWDSIYETFEETAFDYTRWHVVPEPFANAGDYVEVPF